MLRSLVNAVERNSKQEKDEQYHQYEEFADITENTSIKDAIWYYNAVPLSRMDIEKYVFSKLRSYIDWYEIYKSSAEGSQTMQLSIQKIQEHLKDYKDALQVYEYEFNDETLRKIAFESIKINTPNEFDKWLEIHEISYYDNTLRKYALKRCLKLAKTVSQWESIYNISEIGSDIQLKAISKLMKTKRINKSKKVSVNIVKDLQDNGKNNKILFAGLVKVEFSEIRK